MPRRGGSVHVATIRTKGKGGRVYTSQLLRRSYREGGKVRHENLGNLSHLPEPVIDAIRAMLAGRKLVDFDEAFEIERSLPHGHVAAVLGVLRDLDLERLLSRARCRERDLVVAMVVQRLLGPGSKLSATRRFGQSTLADRARSGCGRGGRAAGRDGLAAGAPGADREDARETPSGRGGVHALRPLLELCGGALLPLGLAWLLPRRGAGQGAGHLRADLLARGPPRRDLGARGPHPRPADAARRGLADPGALRDRGCRRGR